jgi:hypothetical protein
LNIKEGVERKDEEEETVNNKEGDQFLELVPNLNEM